MLQNPDSYSESGFSYEKLPIVLPTFGYVPSTVCIWEFGLKLLK